MNLWRSTVGGDGPVTVLGQTFERNERGVLDPQPEDQDVLAVLQKHPCFSLMAADAAPPPPPDAARSRIFAKQLGDLSDDELEEITQIGPVVTGDLVGLTVKKLKLIAKGAVDLAGASTKAEIVRVLLDAAVHEWATAPVPADDAADDGGEED